MSQSKKTSRSDLLKTGLLALVGALGGFVLSRANFFGDFSAPPPYYLVWILLALPVLWLVVGLHEWGHILAG